MVLNTWAGDNIITFADANVKAICVANWDTNGDGELSYDEAAAVTSLGSVFNGNYRITSFDEMQYFTGLTEISAYTFSGCSGLTSITIPSSVTSIGKGQRSAFGGCSGLASITVESGNTVYDSRNNCNAIIETESNTLLLGCQSTVIPNSVASIEAWAFSSSSGLTSINIPNSVTSIGGSAFYGCSGLTSINIPNSVTSIGNDTFYDCSGLTSIDIPNSVTSIGSWAFYGCSGLTSITVESGNMVYDSRDNCNAIIETGTNTILYGCQNSVIPNTVFYIDGWAFYGCSGLTSINIPNSVISIGQCAFSGCTGLTSIDIPNSVTSIGSSAFSGCSGLTSVNIPNSVTSIGSYAFYGCSGLTSINIPNSVTSIGQCAFYGCSGLTSINIPNSVTSIGQCAFSGCSGLTSVNIPNSVTSIGNDTFYGCSGLTSVNIPNSVTSIGSSAFQGCSGLTSIDIPNSVTSIGNYAFYGCSGLTSVNIPNSVTSIGSSAFQGCSGLTSVNIPNSVTSIGSSAFQGCSGLTSINIPNSVTSIWVDAFSGCSGLTSVNIPNSVTGIGQGVFQNCTGLTSVTVNAKTPITIFNDTFSGCPNDTLYVPYGSKTAYEAADYWKEFKEIIEYFINGDVNSDYAVDVSDYLSIANYILEQAPAEFNEAAADVTQDSNVDAADYLGAANIILFGNYQGPQANSANAIKALTTEQASPWMGMDVTEEGLVELLLHDTPTFSAFQMDISLPEGIEIYEANMSKTKQTRNLSYAQLQNGAWRLLYGTLDGKTVSLADRSLLTLKLTSKSKEEFGGIDIEGITLVRPNTSVMHLSGVHGTLPTGISDIESIMPTGNNCYDLTGRRVTECHLKKGIYIINGKKVSIK